jgi:oxygen-dependent protoporphyrinogen oxidase
VGIVNMGFDESVLPVKGFGYLVSTRMENLVLGCVWDSCIFPQQHEMKNQTRLTFMLGGGHHPEIEHITDQEAIEHVLKALHQQMGVRVHPKLIQFKKVVKAIPQFAVGHESWKADIQHRIQQISPRLFLSGTAWTGVSINDCIGQARQLAQRLAGSLHHSKG